MHFQKLALFFTLSAIGLAQDVDHDDVPSACRDICASVNTLARSCDNNTNGDTAEGQCACTAGKASTLCAACISKNGELNNADFIRDCSVSTTDPPAASTVPPATASGTSVVSIAPITPSASNASSIAPISTVSGTTRSSVTPSNAASATSTSGSGGGNAQQTTNAAPAPTMAAAAVGLGGLLGVAGIFL